MLLTLYGLLLDRFLCSLLSSFLGRLLLRSLAFFVVLYPLGDVIGVLHVLDALADELREHLAVDVIEVLHVEARLPGLELA